MLWLRVLLGGECSLPMGGQGAWGPRHGGAVVAFQLEPSRSPHPSSCLWPPLPASPPLITGVIRSSLPPPTRGSVTPGLWQHSALHGDRSRSPALGQMLPSYPSNRPDAVGMTTTLASGPLPSPLPRLRGHQVHWASLLAVLVRLPSRLRLSGLGGHEAEPCPGLGLAQGYWWRWGRQAWSSSPGHPVPRASVQVRPCLGRLFQPSSQTPPLELTSGSGPGSWSWLCLCLALSPGQDPCASVSLSEKQRGWTRWPLGALLTQAF